MTERHLRDGDAFGNRRAAHITESHAQTVYPDLVTEPGETMNRLICILLLCAVKPTPFSTAPEADRTVRYSGDKLVVRLD